MRPIKLIFTTFLTLFLFIVLTLNPGCASKGIPGGGPVDKIPPEIILTFPAADSVNVSHLSKILIHFSEAIDEASLSNNIFISPPLKITNEWQSDTELHINILDSLKDNQTYVIVFGAKIKDIHNNRMVSSHQLAFSTGRKIDQGTISGRIFGGARNASITLFAYEIDSDTIDFTKRTPDYISQSGDKNKYKLSYLREGRFRIFAVNDQNNDLSIDINQEDIGIPYRDVIIDSSDLFFGGLNFRLTNIDTVAPGLSYIRPINNTQINLVFSESVRIDSLNQIILSDSITNEKIAVLSTSGNIESDNIVEAYTQLLDSGKTYMCSTFNISDSSGNTGSDTTISFIARGYTGLDTFRIVEVFPKDSAQKIHPDFKVLLEFSNPVDKESLIRGFSIKNEKAEKINGKMNFISAFESDFKSDQHYLLDTYYSIQLDLKMIKNIWGVSLGDSLYTTVFKVNDGDDYGEITGKIEAQDTSISDVFVEVWKLNSKTDNYSTWTTLNEPYIIRYLTEGFYRVSSYLDSDSNKVYSYGHLFPFTFSEPFTVKTDSVKVRKRWETSNVNLIMPNKK